VKESLIFWSSTRTADMSATGTKRTPVRIASSG
jgi:hypothetical protein